MNAVAELTRACGVLRDKGARTFIIGGDMQLELQPNLVDCTGPHALGRTTARDGTKHQTYAANTWT